MEIRVVDTLPQGGKADAALLLRVKNGDVSAFEQLYYRWNKPLYGFMLKTTRSLSDSEDITQEAFARLWKMRDTLDPEKSIQSLLFTIAHRIAIDIYRRSGKVTPASDDEPGKESSLEHSPQDIMEERETRLLLEIAIEAMPEKQRKVFAMHYFDQLSPKEIALRTGLSYDNVRKHIYNGKRQLREIISGIILLLLC